MKTKQIKYVVIGIVVTILSLAVLTAFNNKNYNITIQIETFTPNK